MDMDYMDRRNIVESSIARNFLLKLHRPTIKGLYSGQILLLDELQKSAVDFIYIVNMPNCQGLTDNRNWYKYKRRTHKRPTLQT